MSISRRQQVALIHGSPIYVITGVDLIPLSSQSDAAKAITQAKESSKQESVGDEVDADEESGSSEDEGRRLEDRLSDDEQHNTPLGHGLQSDSHNPAASTSVAQDVIGKQGQYGRFAERWFSRKGWRTDGRRAQGMSDEASAKTKPPVSSKGEDYANTTPRTQSGSSSVGEYESDVEKQEETSEDTTALNVTSTLLPKLLRTTKMILSSRSFFFSYDYDITRRVGLQEGRRGDQPLHRAVDPMVSVRLCFRALPDHN